MGLSGRRLTLTLVGVLAVVVVVGAGAAFAVGRAQRTVDASPASAPGSSSSTAGPSATSRGQSTLASGAGSAGAGSASAGSPGAVPAPTHGSSTPPVTPSPDRDSATPSSRTSTQEPVRITLSASAEASPHAAEVSGLLRRYFTAINRHDYDAWLTTVGTSQAKRDPDNWLADYRTTHDSNIYVSDINEGDPLTVRMQFVSHQSVELAPSGLKAPCVRWDVTYKIVDEGTGLRVGTSVKAPSMAPCT